jgi:hypothetical protein
MDPVTLKPELSQVILNFFDCSQMLFDKTLKYCVTYDLNQEDFEIHRRKRTHNYKALISNKNFEGATAIELPDLEQFFVSDKD